MTPDRFKLAREINGFTQTDLSRRIEETGGRRVAQSTIAEIETGRLLPSSELIGAIGLATGFPIEFFEQAELDGFPSGTLVMYRSKAATSAKEEARVRRHAQLMAEIASKIHSHVSPLPRRIPRLTDVPPAEAAQLTRAAFGLSPDLPVGNLIRAIERAGVLVLALGVSRDPIDAFSAWYGTREQIPCVAILKDAPGDRQRWTVAHELGHLVLHQSMRGSTQSIEDEADRFAAEFLTPRSAMELELTAPLTLITLRDMKVRWRVSMRSLINRAQEAGVISTRQRSYLFMKLNSSFGGRSEPVSFPPERPRGLRQMFELAYGVPIDLESAAFDLRLTPQMLAGLLDQYQGAATVDHGNLVNFRRTD